MLWGLELLAQLVETGGLGARAGIALAEEMAASNRYLTAGVMKRFKARVLKKEPMK